MNVSTGDGRRVPPHYVNSLLGPCIDSQGVIKNTDKYSVVLILSVQILEGLFRILLICDGDLLGV